MSQVDDIRRAIEALPRLQCTESYGMPIMEEADGWGDYLYREDVLNLFPQAPEIIHHSDPKPSFAQETVMPKIVMPEYIHIRKNTY